jgi:hypothetical protein
MAADPSTLSQAHRQPFCLDFAVFQDSMSTILAFQSMVCLLTNASLRQNPGQV